MDTWAHGILGNKEADKLARDSTNGIPSDQIVGIPFVVGKEVIRVSFETGAPESMEDL